MLPPFEAVLLLWLWLSSGAPCCYYNVKYFQNELEREIIQVIVNTKTKNRR